MVKITFPDGNSKEYKQGVTPSEIAKDLSEGLARVSLAAEVNGNLVDMDYPIRENADFRLITFKDKEGKEIFRHSSAHVLAEAVLKIRPDAKPTIGPAIEEGFYYDFDTEPFTPEDLVKIEKEMKKIINEDFKFIRKEISKEEALKLFEGNEFKQELINEMKDDEKILIYKHGSFIDLCKGPHIPSTGRIKAFKLLKIAGAYWRGNAKNKQLQRIYGISFPEKGLLKNYLEKLEEAEKRNHVKLGKELELFSIHPEGPGFPFFHPKGVVIWNELTKFWREKHRKAGYVEIKTPIILNRALWETSGHWDYYRENMYTLKIDKQDFAVKPMNCPGGILIYKERIHSYREFPLRVAELGIVHRHELSGVLSGLFRVRAFTQDDSHIYCLPEQIEGEINKIIDLLIDIYSTFGFKDYDFEISTKPEKYAGTDEMWEQATNALVNVLKDRNIEFSIDEGEGVFYGPKIDIKIKDALGRKWQCGTIQYDFNLPERFNLTYEAKDGTKKRPLMIHRVIYGSLERFIGILIEHYAGKFPLWLSPVQVRILPISDRHKEFAKKVKNKYFDAGIRVELDDRTETTSKKVRDAEVAKICYILVVGDKEVQNRTVNVRTRDNEIKGEIKVDEFLQQLKKEIADKK